MPSKLCSRWSTRFTFNCDSRSGYVRMSTVAELRRKRQAERERERIVFCNYFVRIRPNKCPIGSHNIRQSHMVWHFATIYIRSFVDSWWRCDMWTSENWIFSFSKHFYILVDAICRRSTVSTNTCKSSDSNLSPCKMSFRSTSAICKSNSKDSWGWIKRQMMNVLSLLWFVTSMFVDRWPIYTVQHAPAPSHQISSSCSVILPSVFLHCSRPFSSRFFFFLSCLLEASVVLCCITCSTEIREM